MRIWLILILALTPGCTMTGRLSVESDLAPTEVSGPTKIVLAAEWTRTQ